MPDRTLSKEERETMSAADMVTEDGLSVDRARWTPAQAAIIKAAAEEPEVERIFVNAAIKKALCETAKGQSWMNKVRAYWGHNYHFHIRIKCPAGDSGCEPQDPVPAGDGCDKSLAWWFTDEALHPRPGKPKPPLPVSALPPECRSVVLEK
jgi:penicillin-insensitive murein DD-endopeptidase